MSDNNATEIQLDFSELLRVRLAAYAHMAWAGWMRYLFSVSPANEDGSVTIPFAYVSRWARQMNTMYDDLPDNEKWSDLVEADKMLALTGKQHTAAEMQCIRCGEKGTPSDEWWAFTGWVWGHTCEDARADPPPSGGPGMGVPTKYYSSTGEVVRAFEGTGGGT